jgi:tRNA(Arg) A34 adenosine deaminase TadA
MFTDRIMSQLFAMAVDVSSIRNYRLAAAVVYKRRMISIGVNELKTHPMQLKYSKNEHKIFIHAEMAAIKNSLRRLDVDELRSCDLYVCRAKYLKVGGKFQNISGLSLPCAACNNAIMAFGFRHIIYSDEDFVIRKVHCHG